MYEDEIVDTHMHFWNLSNDYPWLKEANPAIENLVGDYSSIRQNFLVKDYLALSAAHKITHSVHIDAFGFPEDPIAECAWNQQLADQEHYPHGIVAYANLHNPDIENILFRTVQHNNVRAIRMVLNYSEDPATCMTDRSDYMQDTTWLEGFSLLQKYQLSFELQIYDHQLHEATILAKQFPNTELTLEHLGWPRSFEEKDFIRWKEQIRALAACDNVSLKISGIGCVFQKKIPQEQIISYIQEAVNIFGEDRCYFGSNFPPDSLSYSFDELISIVKKAIKQLPYKTQRKIMHDNAIRYYRLKPAYASTKQSLKPK